MRKSHQAGRATGSVVLLLLIVAGAGGWNYHRNWQLEEASQSVRPYQSYAVEDLEALRNAYASELGGVRAEFDSAKRKRARNLRDVGSIAGNVEQFQQTTQASMAIRMAAAGVSEREGQIGELERELEMRSRFGEGLGRHLKRLTTI